MKGFIKRHKRVLLVIIAIIWLTGVILLIIYDFPIGGGLSRGI